MFHPNDNPMERGWVGRVDGERVLHLAAQTLQAFFLGGGGAREHAEYRLAEVTLLAPVLQPPNVRVFESQDAFGFANTTAVAGPGAVVGAAGAGSSAAAPRRRDRCRGADRRLHPVRRVARARSARAEGSRLRSRARSRRRHAGRARPRRRRAGRLRLRAGAPRAPVPPFEWGAARDLAAAGTTLRPGDVPRRPPAGRVDGLSGTVELQAAGVGVLVQSAT